MAERNRVLPDSPIVAVPARGAWMGNRGCLHEGHQIVRPWRLRAWLVCRLSFRGRHVAQWAPRRYTPLFLLDEAVAFAAGHRPCGECRHHDYLAYRDAAGAATVGNSTPGCTPSGRPARHAFPGATCPTARSCSHLTALPPCSATDSSGGTTRPTSTAPPRSGSVDALTPPTDLDVLRNGVPRPSARRRPA